MSEIDAAFWHADLFACRVGCCGEGEERVVCEADVFRGDDYETAGNVKRVFARGKHAGEVVEGGVGFGAADRFVEGGDGVVWITG